jgi:uncharacterized protein YkuJ
MASYQTDGKKILAVEYDTVVAVGDELDGMRVLSVDIRSSEEMGVFLLEPSGMVTVYVFDEIYIVGKSDSFDTLLDAINAWNAHEI